MGISQGLNMSRQALLLINGDMHTATLDRCACLENRLIVCADGGLRHCLAMGKRPDIIIGDLDSADAAEVARLRDGGVIVIQHPVEKDATDLELALQYLAGIHCDDVIMAGIAGGRLDQTLANLLLMASAEWPFGLSFLDAGGDGSLVTPSHPFAAELNVGSIVSLLPLAERAQGVSTQGLKYPLSKATLLAGKTLGISNVSSANKVQVEVEGGSLLVLTKG